MKPWPQPDAGLPPLELLSVVIPARNEAGSVEGTIEHLYTELRLQQIPHEIVVVDDGSTDATWDVLQEMAERVPTLRAVRNPGENGFGRAVVCGLDHAEGDAVAVMMADESDDCRDLTTYWRTLNQGWDAVFGSRFVRGGSVTGYPPLKLAINRLANLFLRVAFQTPCNDFTNAFKAYRRNALTGCRPFLAPHFNLTIELPLKIVVRGYSWTMVPISWRNRRAGASKLKIQEMGSRYFFIALYCWLEKYFSHGDYKKKL